MAQQRFDKPATGFLFRFVAVSAHTHPSFDKRAHEPWPDRALVVATVALRNTALVTTRVAWLLRSERTQAERGEEVILDDFDDEACLFTVQQCKRQSAYRKDLIWAERCIHCTLLMVDIDNVVKAAAFPVPEAAAKRCDATLKRLLPLVVVMASNPERVQPERLHFDGLADARGDDPIADLRVHPGELHTTFAGHQQTVTVSADAVPCAFAVAFE